MLLLTVAGQSTHYERGSNETTRVLRLKDGQWTEGSRMPLKVGGATGVMVRGKLIVIGGAFWTEDGDNIEGLNETTLEYDLEMDSWATLKTAGRFTPRSSASAVVLGSKVYLVGGDEHGVHLARHLAHALPLDILELNPADESVDGTWSTGPPLPTCPRLVAGNHRHLAETPGVGVISGRIVVVDCFQSYVLHGGLEWRIEAALHGTHQYVAAVSVRV